MGTAVMMITPGDEATPIRFTPIPQYLVALEEGPYGTVDNVYRKQRMKAEAIPREFSDVQISVELQEAIDRAPDKELDLFDCVLLDWSQADITITLSGQLKTGAGVS